MVYKIYRLHCIEPSLVIFSPLLLIIQSSVSNSFHHHLLSFLLSSLYSKFSLSKPFTQNMMHSKRIMETARKWKKHAMRQRIITFLQFGGYTLVRNSKDLFLSFGFKTQPVLIGLSFFSIPSYPCSIS
ncbi:uncharacterized protein LOC110008010 [Amborella trichopoda]|uniref:uncharacterized protein LOC110008010 n=1 Tax=Amborella trichopoda TaxID=13333 RepID=UPI0009BF0A24|nr:uncharacterized protein LOC110008010 [Amborella trichopoda]|eukprot:XP_020528503.1 uncharacterized protein LOC110008010 [Amborella trichopoda]